MPPRSTTCADERYDGSLSAPEGGGSRATDALSGLNTKEPSSATCGQLSIARTPVAPLLSKPRFGMRLDAPGRRMTQGLLRLSMLSTCARVSCWVLAVAVALLGSAVRGQADLFEAAKEGSVEEVRAALEAGADVNAQDDLFLSMPPLMHAARRNPNPDVVRVLLDAGAELEARDWLWGMTSLAHAAWSNDNPDVVRLLLDAGADLNARDEFSDATPLHMAGHNENPDAVRALLDAGADLEARDENGNTPLMHAALRNQSPDVVRLLLDAGANLEARGSQRWTPLMMAAGYNQNPQVVRALLDAGAELEARGEGGSTALIAAAWLSENPEVVPVLLDAGADANARTRDRRRAIDYARENEYLRGTDEYWQLHDAGFD